MENQTRGTARIRGQPKPAPLLDYWKPHNSEKPQTTVVDRLQRKPIVLGNPN